MKLFVNFHQQKPYVFAVSDDRRTYGMMPLTEFKMGLPFLAWTECDKPIRISYRQDGKVMLKVHHNWITSKHMVLEV